MALELGLKVSRTRAPDNATSVSELRISKNIAGPVFVSTETHSSLILTCYLKGYDGNSFQIKISEDGKEITISGEKAVQKLLMMGRVMLKKSGEIVGFRKVFKIPNGVVLDRIKARFEEDESLLKIVMPKLVKGICRVQIEEVKNEGFGESSQKASETEENESVCKKEEGLSDKKIVESTNGDVTADTIQQEIESPRFEAMKKSELEEKVDHVPKKKGEESPEVFEKSENIMPGRLPGITREEKFEETQKEENGEVKFENGGKDEERVRIEMRKKGLEVIERSKEGGESKEVFGGKIGVSGKEKVAEKKEGEIEEPKSRTKDRGEQRVKDIHEETKFECEGKDEGRVGEKIRKEGLEELETAMEGMKFGTNEEGTFERAQERETETTFGNDEGKDKQRAREETNKGALEAIETTMEGRESEKELAKAVDENKQREVEEAKLKTEGKEKEGRETTKEELEAIETRMEEVEPKKVYDGKIEVSKEGLVKGIKQKEIEDKDKEKVEDIVGGIQKRDIQKLESETWGRGEERAGIETREEGLEAMDATTKGGESEMELSRSTGVSEKGMVEETKQRESEAAKFEIEGKDEVRLGTEISKEGLEAMDTTIEGVESETEVSESTGVSEEGMVEETKQRESEAAKFEIEGKDEEKVGTEISKGGLEAMDTTTTEVESETELSESTGVSEEGMVEETKQRGSEATKFEIEGKDEEMVGTKNNKKGFETIESKMEEGESKKVLVGKIGVSEEHLTEATEQRETDEIKSEIEHRDQEKVEEVFKRTPEKEIGKNEFAIEGKDEERVGTEIMEEFEAKDTIIEEEVSRKLPSVATRVSRKDIVEGTKKGESDVPKFENDNRDEEMLKEEISDEEFEAIRTTIKESPMQEPKLPKESEGAFEGIERGEDKSEGAKLKEIEEPSVEEYSKIPKYATSKGENLEEIEEATEATAKRRSQEAEGILEEVEGEKLKKMSKEASKVNENEYARDSRKKEIEEPAIRPPRDGQHEQDNIVSKAFEELGTDTAKFPKPMSETKAHREKEVKVKEEIIVKREKEVKEREEVIVKKYDEVKEEVFERATTGDKIQLETGQPSDGRGFDEEALEAAKWDKIKALKEGCVGTEPSLEKVKGESNDNLQGSLCSPFMEDDKRERTKRTQKENEGPKVGTKTKAQHHVQEHLMKMAESMDEREGPKDTKAEEMKEVKRKSEETQVVSDEESTKEEKIREAEIERSGKTNQFEKDLQEVPEAKDRKASGKGICERESMLSTQQPEFKEIDEVCEECKRSEANFEREKRRTTQSVKDEKLGRENAVKEVAESMRKAPEKEHPGRSEVKHVEAKAVYPEHRKEVETQNEVEGTRLKELSPPKVQSLEPLESEKKNMKQKSPKTKKLVPEAREGEEYKAGKPPEVESSSSAQQSMVHSPKSNVSRTPSEEKEIEALQPNVLSDQNLEVKEHFKTLTEDRGHYLMEKEKILETKKVAEEEKLKQKDEEKTLSCKGERAKIVECKDKKCKMKKNGSEKINQIKGSAEEFRDLLADNETEKSKEPLLPQTAEIQGKEKISEIREVQQEKKREIPFHASEESEAVITNREAESQKPNASHPKESRINFSRDKKKGEVDKLPRKDLLSPSVEKLSKESSKTSAPGVKEDAPKVENFPQFQERTGSTSSLEGIEASEAVANELDKPPAEKLKVTEEGKIDESRDGGHLEVQEPKKQESELDFQESTRGRSDQEVEKIHFLQQEEYHEDHATEEGKADEAENVAQVEISQESEDLEDIQVEASEKKVELRTPLIVTGSVFFASLIIFFFGHKRAGKT